MSEIIKILLKKEREFVEKYIDNTNDMSDETVDKKFDEIVVKLTKQN